MNGVLSPNRGVCNLRGIEEIVRYVRFDGWQYRYLNVCQIRVFDIFRSLDRELTTVFEDLEKQKESFKN